jgi:hypothetical protein
VQRLSNPVPIFLDVRGNLLDNGSIYVGVANQDPQVNPITVYWDVGNTIPAQQPLKTLGGVIVNKSTRSYVFFPDGDVSIRVRDADGNLVADIPSLFAINPSSTAYQPLNTNLTALAALAGQTSYGQNLLTLANQAALQAAVGYVAGLPLGGGTVTGNIVRSGAGVMPYFADAAMTGGRIFITATGAADPTSIPGDIWLTY